MPKKSGANSVQQDVLKLDSSVTVKINEMDTEESFFDLGQVLLLKELGMANLKQKSELYDQINVTHDFLEKLDINLEISSLELQMEQFSNLVAGQNSNDF